MTGNIKGMMWAEHNKDKDIHSIVNEGTQYMFKKMGITPNTIYANHLQYPDQFWVGDMIVVPDISVLQNHYWFVKEEKINED